ncbi:hypothetical protein OIU74_009843 [Salix koriyanagi]|uniref:Uncharacterized protein n=1 Tax=Salix koriyanagi TaxID=2511006 RepID=A0A9Q0QLC3_9ROSI|nr:hypothetical protein OIU74_009843 [Salix koriyanagi]
MLMAGYWDVNFLFFNYCLLREGYARAATPCYFVLPLILPRGKKQSSMN